VNSASFDQFRNTLFCPVSSLLSDKNLNVPVDFIYGGNMPGVINSLPAAQSFTKIRLLPFPVTLLKHHTFPLSQSILTSSQDLVKVAKMIPENASIKMLAFGLAMAHFVYGDNKACILFIVQPGEKNVRSALLPIATMSLDDSFYRRHVVCAFVYFHTLIFSFFFVPCMLKIADQRLLESELWTAHGVRVEFMTLAQIAENSRLGQGNSLFIRPSCASYKDDVLLATSDGDGLEREEEREGEVLVSVAYYRAGYTPNDYPSELEWGARAMIESSAATKCPTVGYQLVGTKKIQQVLCEKGVLERYLPGEDSEVLRRCFASE
jgi:Eukaryotic glutathione synthase